MRGCTFKLESIFYCEKNFCVVDLHNLEKKYIHNGQVGVMRQHEILRASIASVPAQEKG